MLNSIRFIQTKTNIFTKIRPSRKGGYEICMLVKECVLLLLRICNEWLWFIFSRSVDRDALTVKMFGSRRKIKLRKTYVEQLCNNILMPIIIYFLISQQIENVTLLI